MVVKRDPGDEPGGGLDAVRRQLIFEGSIKKENSIVRGQSKFQINPLIKDRKGNSKNLSGVLAEKPNRRGLDRISAPTEKTKQPVVIGSAALPPAAPAASSKLPDVPEEGVALVQPVQPEQPVPVPAAPAKTYEAQQVDRLRALPMDNNGFPSTTQQELGWMLGVAMRIKEGRPITAPSSGASSARSAASSFSLNAMNFLKSSPRPPWSARASTAASSVKSEASTSFSDISVSSTPYDFSLPNVSGGLEKYWRPKSRSDVVTFADNFCQKTGSHPYVRPKTPAA